jgi:hypothetical protein
MTIDRPLLEPSRRWLLFLGLTTGLLPNLVQLAYPFTVDHFIHGWVGLRLIQGEWPYVDNATHNLPGGAMLYALTAAFFGPDAFWFRLFDWTWQLATGLLLFRLAARAAGPWAGFGALILFGERYSALNAWTAGNRDVMLALPYLVAIFLLVKGTNRSLLAGGLVSSLIVLIKPTHGIWWILSWGWIAFQGRRGGRSWKAVAWRVSLFAAGCLAPLILLCGGYLIAGRLQDLIDCLFRYNAAYSSVRRDFAPRHLFPVPQYLWPAVALSAWALVRRLYRGIDSVSGLGVIWLISASFGGFLQGKYYPYHVFPITVALCWWTVVGLADAIGLVSRSSNRSTDDDVHFSVDGFLLALFLSAALLVPYERIIDGASDPAGRFAFPIVSCFWQLLGAGLLFAVGDRLFGFATGLATSLIYALAASEGLFLLNPDPYAYAPTIYLVSVFLACRLVRPNLAHVALLVMGAAVSLGISAAAAELWTGVFKPSPYAASILSRCIPAGTAELLAVLLALWGLLRAVRIKGALAASVLGGPIVILLASSIVTPDRAPDRSTFPLLLMGPVWLAVGGLELLRPAAPLINRLPRRILKTAPALFVAAGALGLRLQFTNLSDDWSMAIRYVAGRTSDVERLEHFSGANAIDELQAAEYVGQNSTKEETIITFDPHYAVGYLSGRGSPSRFFMPRMLFHFEEPGDHVQALGFWSRWREEFLESMTKNPPSFIVVPETMPIEAWKSPDRSALETIRKSLPRFVELLEREYRQVNRFGDLLVYGRVGESAGYENEAHR